jgi:hypothetical protein
MKCNETQSKWCKNKHGASKLIDTLETYQGYAGDQRCAKIATMAAAAEAMNW